MDRQQTYGFQMIQGSEISVIEERERTLIIDLRSEEEFRLGHIQHARNFPYSYIEEWKNEIPKQISVILYCEHGNLSLLAAKKLRGRKGAIYTLTGGYQSFEKLKRIDTAVYRR